MLEWVRYRGQHLDVVLLLLLDEEAVLFKQGSICVTLLVLIAADVEEQSEFEGSNLYSKVLVRVRLRG